jgi:hypothetical protein
MTRRLILATCLLGVIGGTAGTAMAGPVRHHGHELCVVLTKHDDTTQDYCVNWDGTPTK